MPLGEDEKKVHYFASGITFISWCCGSDHSFYGSRQRAREVGEKGQGQRARELRKKSGDWEKGRGNWENRGERFGDNYCN